MSSTIQRFTPPTCTLEITGEKFPLSHWTKQEIWQKLQFELKFDDPRIATANQVIIKGQQQDLAKLQLAIDNYVPKHLHTPSQSLSSQTNPQKSQVEQDEPHLESQGLVNHKLYFGNLLHNSDQDHIKLSTVQLFDLVTALAAYQAEIATLKETKQSTPARKKAFFWGGIALGAIAVAGVTTILSPSRLQENSASSTQTESSIPADIPELAEIIPPPTPEASKQNRSQVQRTKPLTSATRLPPPPAVDTPKPKPDIPDPADYPLADVARQSGLSNAPKSADTVEPKKTTTVVPPTDPKEPEKPAIIAQDNTPKDNAIELKPAPELNELKSSTENQQQINPFPNSVLDFPKNSPAKTNEEPIPPRNSNLALRDASSPASQIQEVTTYFKNHWQPPADLKQSLEYRLLLNADGSIKKIIPLGKASRLYLSRTKIPVNGESFISPPTPSQSSAIRLLLNPDGQIQAFNE
ncbi:MAG: DUF4335 domain-containing protein [Cyanobacteria bacterium P01_A01_bin.83]